MTLHALLVGINDYHPEAKVTPLRGCVNDVTAMQAYLKKKFQGSENITTLVNEKASRENVINGFKKTLIGKHVEEGDIVLFFYSGHGSTSPTAPEFAALGNDTRETDETLVLYDSRLKNGSDLADKELALLLAAVNQSANIIVILDSCHSGSATRNVAKADEIKLGTPKFEPPSKDVVSKNLKQYLTLDGFDYSNMEKLKIPLSKHVLLAACGRDELAYEAPEPHALFTDTLLKLLDTLPTTSSYTDVHKYLYTRLRTLARKQTPQLKPYGGFNPKLEFLGNSESAGKPGYTASYNGQDWILNYGALNGMPMPDNLSADIKVGLYKPGKTKKLVSTGTIGKIGLNESILKIDKVPENTYQLEAEIINHPPSLCIYVRGDEKNVAKFFSIRKKQSEGMDTLEFHQDPQAYYSLILEITADEMRIIEAETKKLLHGIKKIDNGTVAYIINALRQIGKYYTFARLQNTATNINAKDITFNLQLKDEEGNWNDCKGTDLTIDITEDKPEVPFRIRLDTSSAQGYYVALYYLSPTFSIKKYTSDVDASLLTEGKEIAIESNVDDESYILAPDKNEEIETYKLIISKDPFYDYFLEENDDLEAKVITSIPGTNKGVKKMSKGDWVIKTITVRLVRQIKQVDDKNKFTNNVLTIQPHPSFKAAVSLTPLHSTSKSLNPVAELKEVFSGDEFSFINLSENSKSAAAADETVVELIGIKNESSLENEPLKMNLKYVLEENEEVLAVTISDGLIVPIGIVEKSKTGNEHNFYLHQAPVTEDLQRKNAKNPLRALWFCFLKVVCKKEDEVFKLREIEFKDSEVKYKVGNLTSSLEGKHSVLLVVHGIIGNTKSIAANMEFFLNEKEHPYDAIIAFDYENLNTGIETIAKKLKEKLKEAGVSGMKKIDIVAHSMGGLVSRYMVEKLDGDKLISRLFLVGVPNNGSNFGNLVTIRNWVTGVLTLVCNYGKSFLGQFGPFLSAANSVLKATGPVTNTLAQMKRDSDFLKYLNKANGKMVNTKYFVLAGNTANYNLKDETTLKKTMEKIKVAIGKLAYWSEENDIAVSVKSIKTIRTVIKETEVGCHHMNYFEYKESLAALKELMKK